ncbi:MAG: cupin domain-containing protein [Acidobacteriota bacterium]
MRITERITEPVFNFGGKAFCPLIGPATDLGGTTHQWVAHVVIPAGQSFPAHYHKLAEETYYIIRGTALMTVDGERFLLGPWSGDTHDAGRGS